MNIVPAHNHLKMPEKYHNFFDGIANMWIGCVAIIHNENETDHDVKKAIKFYDSIEETIEQFLVEKNCFVASTDQFKFTLNLHDDCADLINVEPLNVH